MPIVEDVFDTGLNPITKINEPIKRFTMTNSKKSSVQVLTFGASIISIKFRGTNFIIEDVALGYDKIKEYQDSIWYIGSTVGRVANRVRCGKFTLDKKVYNITKNMDNKHQLHGGFIGFDRVHWTVSDINQEKNSLTLEHISADGSEGYPGEVKVTCVYRLTDDNEFHCNLTATTNKATPINIMNHAYFNLAGHGAGRAGLFEHEIKLNGNQRTVTDVENIPTGEIVEVVGTAYDLQNWGNLGDRINALLKSVPNSIGFDDNFCIPMCNTKTRQIAKIWHRPSGRWMEVLSNQPGVQFYTTNKLPNEGERPVMGKGGASYYKYGAFCLETQKYPDSVNHPNFPTTILRPGQTYDHHFAYRFGATQNEKEVYES